MPEYRNTARAADSGITFAMILRLWGPEDHRRRFAGDGA